MPTPTRGTMVDIAGPDGNLHPIGGYTPRNNKGLVIHRHHEFRRTTADSWEPVQTNKWMVTHKSSGLRLIDSNLAFKTKKDAVEFSDKLVGVDWEVERENLDLPSIKQLVSDALKVRNEALEEEAKKEFFVQRNDKRNGYDVVNGSGEVMESFYHRGIAADYAAKLRSAS